jgi:HEAT repeat protein
MITCRFVLSFYAAIVFTHLFFIYPYTENVQAQERTASEVNRLIESLKENLPTVRLNAARALSSIGPDAKAAIPALIEAMKDEDAQVRFAVVSALGSIGPEAKAAVPALIETLRDEESFPGSAAEFALGRIGTEAVPALIEALRDSNLWVRSGASHALEDIGTEAVPALIETLRDSDLWLKSGASDTLWSIGTEAVPALIETLRAQDADLRQEAASVLGRIGSKAKAAAPALIEALKDQDVHVSYEAASALGSIGMEAPEAKAAVPALIEAFKDLDAPFPPVRYAIVNTLGILATILQDAKATEMIGQLEVAGDTIRASHEYAETGGARTIVRAIEYLKLVEPTWRDWVSKYFALFIDQHPWITFLLLVYVLWGGICLVAFWMHPEVLLRINQMLRPWDVKMPQWLGGMTIPSRFLLVAGFLNYRPRVLDSWIKARISAYRNGFEAKSTVNDRAIHISVPVVMGETIPELSARDLWPTFGGQPGTLLIWGEGGSGKTSLACQIAKWAMSETRDTRLCEHLMLPILIEHELDSGESRDALVATIAGQLESLIGQPEPVEDELLRRLLTQRRILVIVDHLSEMSEAIRRQINPEQRGFPAKALIVTSRIKEDLGGAVKTIMKPLRIRGNRLSSFMEAYLIRRGKRDHFDDPEFFHACGRLSAMVGDRDITVLLAKLYAEQMISSKEHRAETQLPKNIPDLMLSYLNEVNRGVTQARLDDRLLHRATKVIAWECLRKTLRPGSARYDDVIAALDSQNAEAQLKYVEDQLRLIETVLPRKDCFRFVIDPLAEYLAGLCVVDHYGENRNEWAKFLAEAKKKEGAPETIRGFLLAVRDCCLAKGEEAKIPESVIVEIEKLARSEQGITAS